MRRVLILSGLSLALFAQNTEQGVAVPGGFMTGHDYLILGAQSRVAYSAGFFNGMTTADAIRVWNRPGQLDTKWVDDCGKGISAGKGMTDVQIAEILHQYIQNRPTDWNHALNLLGLNAMLAACQNDISIPPARRNQELRSMESARAAGARQLCGRCGRRSEGCG